MFTLQEILLIFKQKNKWLCLLSQFHTNIPNAKLEWKVETRCTNPICSTYRRTCLVQDVMKKKNKYLKGSCIVITPWIALFDSKQNKLIIENEDWYICQGSSNRVAKPEKIHGATRNVVQLNVNCSLIKVALHSKQYEWLLNWH